MKIRVVRILEYTYADAEVAANDMRRWQVGINSAYSPNTQMTVSSATLPFQVVNETTHEVESCGVEESAVDADGKPIAKCNRPKGHSDGVDELVRLATGLRRHVEMRDGELWAEWS